MIQDLEFAQWLLSNCVIKQDFFLTHIECFWTLSKDYENSWDGDDVKRYTTEQIYDYYIVQKK